MEEKKSKIKELTDDQLQHVSGGKTCKIENSPDCNNCIADCSLISDCQEKIACLTTCGEKYSVCMYSVVEC